ncbi:MAG TPA: YceK/YidQ family lipoprotein [Burkholderiales bacterium]
MIAKLKRSISGALLATITSLSLLGCMSLQSKLAEDTQIGHPYSGVTGDALVIRCAWEMPGIAKEKDGTSYFASVPLATLLTLLFLIDTPFSAIADTLLLPLDIAKEPTRERWSLSSPPCNRKQS